MGIVVAWMDDLMFLSRIREAARGVPVELRSARRVAELLALCREGARLVLADLDSARLPTADALAALRGEPGLPVISVVGFFSHVHAERGRDALAAGCDRVLPRSAFVQQLGELLGGLDPAQAIP